MDIEKRISDLEEELDKLKYKKKDTWDRFKIVGSILVPFAIAFVGWQYSVSMKDAEIQSARTLTKLQLEFSKQQETFDQEISLTNTRVSQVGLVASFLEPLLSTDKVKQKLAIEAVLIALPTEGPRLVKVIQESDESSDVKNFAQQSLASYRAKLIAELFSENKTVRTDAYRRLVAAYNNDSTIIPDLIAAGRQFSDSRNGVFNVLVFLSHMNKDALTPYVDEIATFSREVEQNGPKTKERAEKLRSRLPSR
ncbi:hypothetical protein A3194_12300 [Candidatus Thiodiazotropha endoloripes]|uniref:hypothetical protein n=1 Tax=Candidatus Thiodiazotropha endoloripes TaxID=1818881 RepID=UPI00083DCE5D|nr:hypothetical protein [Candidatus Thiodiazotropha endoloripes]ODB85611.1 hypothetical protein A3194_12300 [Candidatus Thiodiazotropha endoloripes]